MAANNSKASSARGGSSQVDEKLMNQVINASLTERMETSLQKVVMSARKKGNALMQDDDEEFNGGDYGSKFTGGLRRFNQANRLNENLGNIKIKVPSFQGRSDPEAYLDWESKIEKAFDFLNYTEEEKVKLAAVQFTDYANIWWDHTVTSRRRKGEQPIDTWEAMKDVMRRRFIPSHYNRDLYNKLNNLKQGSRSVEDYYREMEIIMTRANAVEDDEITMARFLAGLNIDIAREVGLRYYVEMIDMLHFATRVEDLLNKKDRSCKGSENNTWPEKNGNKPKPNIDHTLSRSSDIVCYKCQGKGHVKAQCPNQRMMMKKDGEWVSESEDEQPPMEDLSHATEADFLC